MTGECTVAMDSVADAADQTSLNIQAGRRSRLSVALVAVALCLAAAAAAAALLVFNVNAKVSPRICHQLWPRSPEPSPSVTTFIFF